MYGLTSKHFFIGLTVLLGFFFLIYLGLQFHNKQGSIEYKEYDLHFSDSASGLSPGSPVKFKGVTIGTVDKIQISQENNDRIDVTVKIQNTFSIKEGMYAVLEVAGITGESRIQISGSHDESGKILEPQPGKERPVIPLKPSSLQKLIHTAPELLTNAQELIKRVSELFTEENKKEFSSILKNINHIFDSVNNNQENIEEILQNILIFTRSLNSVTTKVTGSLEELDKSNQSFQALMNSSNTLVKDIRPGLKDFTDNGLGEMNRTLLKLAQTLEKLDDFTETFKERIGNIIPDGNTGTYELK